MSRPKDCTSGKNLQIALTLSGGGYRASVFHIGVLSYLYHLKLDDGTRMLDHVTVMSTVSGGTITGVNYLLALRKGGELNVHLAELFDRIKKNNLADKVLEKVSENKNNPALSIIKELGNVYDEVFFEGKGQTFSDLQEIVQKSAVHHFSAYATDITNAMPFRFQAVKDCYKGTIIGNENWEIKATKAGKIRIADIVAASSCFPIVFEPINYPRDFFIYEKTEERAQTNMQVQLMDGGIIDNQGVDYLYEANRQMADGGDENEKGVDFAIISDAASSAEEEPLIPAESSCQKYLRIAKFVLYYITLWFLIVKVFALFKNTTVNVLQYSTLFMTLLFGLLGWYYRDSSLLLLAFSSLSCTSMIFSFLIFLGKKYAPSALKKSKQYQIPKNLVWKINFLQYQRQLKKRYDSFSKVVSTVMMGHIRKRNLMMIMENTRWTNRVIVPCISSLSSNADWKHDETSSKLMTKASDLMGFSDRASNFHSTLWFSKTDIDNQIPEKILACGQFSICYELYLWSLKHKGNHSNMTKVLGQLKTDSMIERFNGDWEKFKKTPYWMVDLKTIQ